MNITIIMQSYSIHNSFNIFNHLYFIEEIVYKSYIKHLNPKFKNIIYYTQYNRNKILKALDLDNYYYVLNDIMNKLLYKKILNFYLTLELKFFFRYKQLYNIHNELIQYVYHPININKFLIKYGYEEFDNYIS